MKERLRSYRLSPAGGGLVLVLVAAVLVLAAGPGSERVPAIVVIVIVALMLIVQPGGTRAAWTRTLQERRDEVAPSTRNSRDEPPEPAEQDALWTEERERYGR